MVSYTVIIISEGRFDQLAKCLESLKGKAENWQLIVACIGHELSADMLQRIKVPKHDVLYFLDPVTNAQARNRALELAEGEWIHFLDEEASWDKDYFETIEPCLGESKMEIIGGPDLPRRGVGIFSHAIALSLSSPFCSGPTFPRYRSLGEKITRSDEEKLSAGNIWIRKYLLTDKPFPEEYNQGEMTHLLQRLKLAGHTISYHPRLIVTSIRSAHFLSLRKKIFQKGFERSLLIREKLASGAIVFTLPTLFVMLHLFLLLHPALIWPLYKLYLLLTMVVSVGLSFRARRPWIFPLVFFFHYFIVWEYGWGFLYERISHKWRMWNS